MVFATVENTLLTFVPKRATPPMITTATKAAIKAYSSAVTPRLSLMNFLANRTISLRFPRVPPE